MRVPFTKMHGAGNDYIYFDAFARVIEGPEDLALRLSDRHFGVGGDGVVVIAPSAEADARMRMFNADGSEGRMCGNAIRCVAKYLYERGLVTAEDMTIETRSGIKSLALQVADGRVDAVRVNMGAPELRPAAIPVDMPGEAVIAAPLEVAGHTYAVTCVSMGNPHAVIFVDVDLATLDLPAIGPAFEHHPAFPDRINTEFVRVHDERTLEMRVWERGSGETLACGTGACAVAVAAARNGHCQRGAAVTVCLRGGDLIIQETDAGVLMTGGCVTVFDGEVDLDDLPPLPPLPARS